jgi:hypothetical protein
MQLSPALPKKTFDYGGGNTLLSHPTLPEEGSALTSSVKSLHELGMRHLQRQVGQN